MRLTGRTKNAGLLRFISTSKPGDERLVDVPVPHVLMVTPQERVQNRTAGLKVEVSVPQIHEDNVEVTQLILARPYFRVHRGTHRGSARSADHGRHGLIREAHA